jgi:hypothetical protein
MSPSITPVNKSRKGKTLSLREFHNRTNTLLEPLEEIDENTCLHLFPNEILTMIVSYLTPGDIFALSSTNKSMKITMEPFMDKALCDAALSERLSIPRTMKHKHLIDKIREYYPNYNPQGEYYSDDDYESHLTPEDEKIIKEIEFYNQTIESDEEDFYGEHYGCDYCGMDYCSCHSNVDDY